ncbi:UNVERIFIED_CONTAM: hypothetical protein K2H54_044502, partial [Gekko kuhli]
AKARLPPLTPTFSKHLQVSGKVSAGATLETPDAEAQDEERGLYFARGGCVCRIPTLPSLFYCNKAVHYSFRLLIAHQRGRRNIACWRKERKESPASSPSLSPFLKLEVQIFNQSSNK